MSKAFKVWLRVLAVAFAFVAALSIHTRTALAEDAVECPIGEATTYTYESSVYPLEFRVSESDLFYVNVSGLMIVDDTYYYSVSVVPKPNSAWVSTYVWAYNPETQTDDGCFAVSAVPQTETLDVCVGQSVYVDLTGYSDSLTSDPIDSLEVADLSGYAALPGADSGTVNCVVDSYDTN